jgi:hypothetical protein
LKNKIFVRLVGGYGNQLFIYAFGLAMSKRTGRKLILDNISGFGSSGDEYNSLFALSGLSIEDKLISQSRYRYFIANKYFWYLARKLKISHTEMSISRHKEVDNIKKYFFEGYWQSYLYFDEYKEEIKRNLTLVDSDNLNIKDYKKQILQSKNSVAIGMRFYEETASAISNHTVKDEDYYTEAITLIETKLSEPKYFIFSTDIPRAREVMSKSSCKDVVYIDPIKAKDNAKLDFYLMSLCQNFIISNGTFYWWAAYLGENKKSIVISPKNGFNNLDAIPLNWIKL